MQSMATPPILPFPRVPAILTEDVAEFEALICEVEERYSQKRRRMPGREDGRGYVIS